MEFLDWLNNDYYNFLGVKHTATSEEIGKAYRAKAKLCHPDTYPLYSPERFRAEQDFKQLQLIKETLLDPLKKEEYDKERLFAQECYLNSMVYTFPVKPPEPQKNKFREILHEVEEKDSVVLIFMIQKKIPIMNLLLLLTKNTSLRKKKRLNTKKLEPKSIIN